MHNSKIYAERGFINAKAIFSETTIKIMYDNCIKTE